MKDLSDYPVAFCHKPNTWPPEFCEGVQYEPGRPWTTDRDSYPVSEFVFGDFVEKPSLWVNVHTESKQRSSGKVTKRWSNDIEFDSDTSMNSGIGPFVAGDERMYCDHWILITNEEEFDRQYKAWLREKFAQGDMSRLVQGTLF